MAGAESKNATLEFAYLFSCDFCSENESQTSSAQIPDQVMQYFEQKAAYKLWDCICDPMMSYITSQQHMSCEMVRFILNSLENEKPRDVNLLQTLLQHSSRTNPPCRSELREFYNAVVQSPLESEIFSQEYLQDFFGLMNKIQSTVNSEVQPKRKATYIFNDTNNLHNLMVAFKFYLDIFGHDFLSSSASKRYSLLYSVLSVGNRFVPHCKQIFNVYISISDKYRSDFAIYLTLLSEIVRWYDIDQESWPTSKSKDIHHGFIVCFGDQLSNHFSYKRRMKKLRKEASERILTLIEQLPSKWLRRQLCDYLQISTVHENLF